MELPAGTIYVVKCLAHIAEEEPKGINSERRPERKTEKRKKGDYDAEDPPDRLDLADLIAGIKIEPSKEKNKHPDNDRNKDEHAAHYLILAAAARRKKKAANAAVNQHHQKPAQHLQPALHMKKNPDQSIVFLWCHDCMSRTV